MPVRTAAALLLLLQLPLLAQNTELSGVVTDPQGQPSPAQHCISETH